jgi:maltooligosyltrehalose trehalohydrolase
VLTLTSPFTPMLFMGEEFAATTLAVLHLAPEPELGKATAEGRIKEFERMGWDPAVVPDPQDPETFRRSKLDWNEAAEGDHARLLELYRSLTALRRSTPELAGLGFGDTDVSSTTTTGWLRFRRGGVEVLLNFSDAKLRLAEVRRDGPAGHRRRTGLEAMPSPSAPWSAAVVLIFRLQKLRPAGSC